MFNFNYTSTNWKYLSIITIIGFIVGVEIFGFVGSFLQEEIKTPEAKTLKNETAQNSITPINEELNAKLSESETIQNSAASGLPADKAGELVPQPIAKKISVDLATIFRKEINKKYYVPPIQEELPGKPVTTYGIECDASQGIDLNSDGVEEFIVFPYYLCGGSTIYGAQGNGPIYIFQKIDGDWWNIGELQGNELYIEKTKTNGYYDITTSQHYTAGSNEINLYQWQDSTLNYELKKSEIKIWYKK